MPPSRLVVLLLWVVSPAFVSALAAQAPRHEHSAGIERVLAQIGGIEEVAGATPANVGVLAQHLMARGQMLLDLYEYHRLVGRDYTLLRDSIAEHGGVGSPTTPYFLARSLHELGDADGALRAYRQSTQAPVPPAFQRRASAWAATLSPTASGPATWQRRLSEWRGGEPISTDFSCPDEDEPECRLFMALAVNDPVMLLNAQRRLMNDPQPDHVHQAQGPTGSLRIEFHDPLQLFLLAVSDFALAAHVTGHVGRGAELARGVALIRTRRLREAEAALARAGAGGGVALAWAKVYRGEVEYRLGQREAAAELWSTLEKGSGPALAALDVRSGLDPAVRGPLMQQFRLHEQRGLQDLRGRPEGVYLGRALLREGFAEEALKLLQVVRPPSWGHDLDRVQPQVLVLLSRARYESGRDQYALARGDLARLADPFPVIRPLLMMLQEVTAPSHVPSVRSGG